MKRTHVPSRSLSLAAETVRPLYRVQLAMVAGGLVRKSGVIGGTCPASGTSDQPSCTGDPVQQ